MYAPDDGNYRVVISRDGAWWVAGAWGKYLPDNGAEARSDTLAGVKEEVFRLQMAARTSGGSSQSYSFEYDLWHAADARLEAFRQVTMAQWTAERQRTERAHEIAADLAAVHNASPEEIADILGLCCATEAAEVLSYQGAPLVASRSCPHAKEQRTTFVRRVTRR